VAVMSAVAVVSLPAMLPADTAGVNSRTACHRSSVPD
jgi:hypothetical protein